MNSILWNCYSEKFLSPALDVCSVSRKAFSSVFHELIGLHGFVFPLMSVLKGMDTVTFTVYIIYSCLCGDTMAANNALSLLHRVLRLCQSLWQSPTSRHGQRLWQTAPQAQPWFDCPTSIYFQHTATKLEVCVCVALRVHLRGLALFWLYHQRDQHPFFQMLFSRFQHLYIQHILHIPATR
ncbi:hypothetical protein AMECASPLE_038333 [Ameca splendens]|uniref:Uncharacterized protein n=1 Tax=Ameca splendens TaxID=208324 RepID=A0ABV0YJK9_9TELE